MMPLQFITWWYGQGWRAVATSFVRRNHAAAEAFSVGALARTMFAPWRRIVSHPGASLNDHFHAWLDNFVSRIIGFLVRFFVLIAALVSLFFISVFSIIELIIWPCLPLAVVVLLVKGLLP